MSDVKYGLTLSSEEHPPQKLIDLAVAAETHGFDFVSISDHYHPWLSAQGHSPFVWSVLGGIAAVTDHIEVGVGVSCPTMRMHPAIVAQAVATTACLLEDRFTWGVGTGENLNEHVIGAGWPTAPERREMLVEAIDVVRRLLGGDSVSMQGDYYTVEDARLFDVPATPPPIVFSAFGPDAARTAAQHGDGLWITGPDNDTIATFRAEGGTGPVWTQLSLSWDPDADTALERAVRQWPNTGLPGQLNQDLRTVLHFEQAVALVTEDVMRDSLPYGPDVGQIIDSVRTAEKAGADHIYLHQVGDPAAGFLDVWQNEIRPELRG